MTEQRVRYPWREKGTTKQRRAIGVFVRGQLVIYRSLPPNVEIGWTPRPATEPADLQQEGGR